MRALLGDQLTLSSPAEAKLARQLLDTVLVEAVPVEEHWVALTAVKDSLSVDMDAALLSAPASIQDVLGVPAAAAMAGSKPLAVGRLRTSTTPPRIDYLLCSLPKEDPLHGEALGLVVDALMLAWAEYLAREDTDACDFEALRSSSSTFAESRLVSRGFVAIAKPDFTALGRGEPILTHAARLPNALLAAKARAAQAELTSLDKQHADRLVAALQALQPPPVPLALGNDQEDDEGAASRDPWGGIKGFGMS